MQNVSKRTILWIVPIIILAIFWYFYGPQKEITDNEYISYIKQSSIETSPNTNLENAFGNYCAEGKWVFFKTQKDHNVVEFKGECPVNGDANSVNLQFVVEDDQKGYKLGALLLNGEQQSAEQREDFLNMVVSK
ncbi:glucosamine 6-phosphate synthetase [Lysinibacillus sp. BW-2-10]|uniref:glucosamine 6-phosphate synthetase n=1 Tax=Lysinibacillus sp. BW-2-10 TaxID=2590030 RepID=UPI00117DAD37|nr:glucosamine 6-phosphate synthetase [Lysinibacillus sp. BW-2-10]TSI06713.1 glucosamine 6-phosphate synthetase [Lysinibacillus sp. BW-2-10]